MNLHDPNDYSGEAKRSARSVVSQCIDCGACARKCAFLEEYGSPLTIARQFLEGEVSPGIAFECSLCGLCHAVCPEGVEVDSFLLRMRRVAWNGDAIDQKPYRGMLSYEKIGRSRLFSLYDFPSGCDTVFFPGCTLPATRPGTTMRLIRFMKKHVPTMGVVLDCCHKPSHDLGNQENFQHYFDEIMGRLKSSGVRRVIVACPNCHKVFKLYGQSLEIVTAYEFMAEYGLPEQINQSPLPAVMHDPCPLRKEPVVHDAVRNLSKQGMIQIEHTKSTGKRTICCGEGGTVGAVRPDFASRWSALRHRLAQGRTVVTYCAGCAGFLSRNGTAVHLLDALFYPAKIRSGRFKPVSFPLTYLARLALKLRVKFGIR